MGDKAHGDESRVCSFVWIWRRQERKRERERERRGEGFWFVMEEWDGTGAEGPHRKRQEG